MASVELSDDEDLEQDFELVHPFMTVPEEWDISQCFELAKVLIESKNLVQAFNILKNSILYAYPLKELEEDQRTLFFQCCMTLMEHFLKSWHAARNKEIKAQTSGGSAVCPTFCKEALANCIKDTNELIQYITKQLMTLKTDVYYEVFYLTLQAQSLYFASEVLEDAPCQERVVF